MRFTPHCTGQRGVGADAVRVASQFGKDRVFLADQAHFLASTKDTAGGQIYRYRPDGEDTAAASRTTAMAQRGPNAREQFFGVERFDHIVVRTKMKRSDFLRHGIARLVTVVRATIEGSLIVAIA